MLTDSQISDLCERISLARLMEEEKILVDVKVISLLIQEYTLATKNRESITDGEALNIADNINDDLISRNFDVC